VKNASVKCDENKEVGPDSEPLFHNVGDRQVDGGTGRDNEKGGMV
jgi:hypothetical protein